MSVTDAVMTVMSPVALNPEKMYANGLTALLLMGAHITYERDGRAARIEQVEVAGDGRLFVQASGSHCAAAEEIPVATPLSIVFARGHEAQVPDAVQLSFADAYPDLFLPPMHTDSDR